MSCLFAYVLRPNLSHFQSYNSNFIYEPMNFDNSPQVKTKVQNIIEQLRGVYPLKIYHFVLDLF